MSFRYTLCNSAAAAAAGTGESNNPSALNTTALGQQQVAATVSLHATSPHSYSDVVATRPASPASMQGNESALSSSMPVDGQNSQQMSDTSLGAEVIAETVPEDDGGGPWTVVCPRRARSTGSLGGHCGTSTTSTFVLGAITLNTVPADIIPAHNTLTLDQEVTIALARAGLTPEQKRMFNNHHKATVESATDTSSDTAEPVHPSAKDKGPDPRNWGGIALPASEIDVEEQ
ncbi:hypothetical protein DXG01_014824 [Tephrocybe rancida]|nr:hypothetical protein DXG01_014824 [Tephrocybe rancida]